MTFYENELSQEVSTTTNTIDWGNFLASSIQTIGGSLVEYTSNLFKQKSYEQVKEFEFNLEARKIELQKEIEKLQAEITSGLLDDKTELLKTQNELQNIKNKQILYTSVGISVIGLTGIGIFYIIKKFILK